MQCCVVPARYSWVHHCAHHWFKSQTPGEGLVSLLFLELPGVRAVGWVLGYSQVHWVPLCWTFPWGMKRSPLCYCKLLWGSLWLLYVFMHQIAVQNTCPFSPLWVVSGKECHLGALQFCWGTSTLLWAMTEKPVGEWLTGMDCLI